MCGLFYFRPYPGLLAEEGSMAKHRFELGANPAICQKWEEREYGWGERPDGFSLHLSYDGLSRFVQEYWDGMPDEVQSEYSIPLGMPYDIGVSDEVYKDLQEAGTGLRYYESNYPGSGGVDGWLPAPPNDIPND